MFAGVFGAVLIVFFKDKDFQLISTINDVFSDEISHLKYLDNFIYVSSPANNEIVKIGFPKLVADNRRKSVLGGFDVKFIQGLSNHKIQKVNLESSLVSPRKSLVDGSFCNRREPALEDRRTAACLSAKERILRLIEASERLV